MLPPMLPLSAVPITAQQDPVRQRPDIPPVVPVQQSSNESTIDLQNATRKRPRCCCARNSVASRNATGVAARPMKTLKNTWPCRVPNSMPTILCRWRR